MHWLHPGQKPGPPGREEAATQTKKVDRKVTLGENTGECGFPGSRGKSALKEGGVAQVGSNDRGASR